MVEKLTISISPGQVQEGLAALARCKVVGARCEMDQQDFSYGREDVDNIIHRRLSQALTPMVEEATLRQQGVTMHRMDDKRYVQVYEADVVLMSRADYSLLSGLLRDLEWEKAEQYTVSVPEGPL